MTEHECEHLVAWLNTVSHHHTVGELTRGQQLNNSVAGHLRYKWGRRRPKVPLRAELEESDRLLDLFYARFPDRVESSIESAEGTGGLFVPHYSIAALVENAVFHAFPADADIWSIMITVTHDGGVTEVSVRDNGVGFDTQTVGISARLSGGQVRVESTVGHGTCVILTLPSSD